MEQRINLYEKAKGVLTAMHGINTYIEKSLIEKSLRSLIDYRLSQINGCAWCLDMHSKDLRADGESEQRIYVLDAWRETPFFSDRERAALEWAEAINACDVSDQVFEKAREQFSEQELIDLTVIVNAINGYNRLNIAFKPTVGTYKVGQFAVQSK